MRKQLMIFFLLITTGWVNTASAESILTVTTNGKPQSYNAQTLLNRSDAVDIQVEYDVSYQRQMTYRAIPLAALFGASGIGPDTFLEAKASDGFVSQLPGALVQNRDPSQAVAMLAVEEPSKPWPLLPGKSRSAGPFYIVWTGAKAAKIRSEQWPYQLAELTPEETPVKRWPQLAVDASLPKEDPRRLGQQLFVVQCLVCHQLDGGGNASIGPDLNRPMNPTEYFTLPALRKFLRNPASVRNWPERKMPAFETQSLSDADIDSVIAYLQYKAAAHK